MFDTHCHLNFKRFGPGVREVVERARRSGVRQILIPGTDVATSQKAVEIARDFSGIYAAAGIHPHHLFELYTAGRTQDIPVQLKEIGALLDEAAVLAVGEVGIDRHDYQVTKYQSYTVTHEFVLLQKQALVSQLQLAITKGKSLILHNREAKQDLMEVMKFAWSAALAGRTVFHCCEPDHDLLAFAKANQIMIGVDGDVTYDRAKQEFVEKVPLELLVLETDAPYLLPEPLRSQKKFPNEPAYLTYTAELVAKLKRVAPEKVMTRTTANARFLFGLPEDEGQDDGGNKTGSV